MATRSYSGMARSDTLLTAGGRNARKARCAVELELAYMKAKAMKLCSVWSRLEQHDATSWVKNIYDTSMYDII